MKKLKGTILFNFKNNMYSVFFYNNLSLHNCPP